MYFKLWTDIDVLISKKTMQLDGYILCIIYLISMYTDPTTAFRIYLSDKIRRE